MRSENNTNQAAITPQRFIVGDWDVEPARGQIHCEGKTVKLEPKVMDVLCYLAARPGELITRDDLERDVWKGAIVSYDSLTTAIIKLRKALTDNARNPRYIETIPKRGYRLIATVSHHQDAETNIDKTASSETQTAPPFTPYLKSWGLLAALLLITLSMVLIYQRTPLPKQSASVPQDHSIVVLPFDSLDDNPKLAGFADGMTDDIITDLSSLSGLQVIASNTAFTLKQQEITPQQIGNELGVDFVLQGSIRYSGNAIRVNAQLIDTKSGYQKWAERYDRQLAEVFSVQDEMTSNIVSALALQLTSQDKVRLSQRNTNNLDAYQFFQQGQRLARQLTKKATTQAQTAYREAIRRDPNYGRAYGALAYSLALTYRRGWTDTPIETLDRALVLARQAVGLGADIPQTHWALSYVHLMRREYESAEKAATQAVTVAPNYADGYALLGLIHNNLGNPQQAIELINKGMTYNPYYTWDYPYNLGRAYYSLGRYDEAVTTLESALERNENVVQIRLYLAASYMHVDRKDDAEWEIEQIIMQDPATTLSHTRKSFPLKDSAQVNIFLEDLRAAGLPE
ncbi:MAG: winged helix-turn-helix domain-containing tetratricopeptide repeat protein [Chromatiales bacterium]|nr:winged helix-turn-helix domain-containing tetratricopeptide repeat protein [Chromatiales bacterium]